MRLPPAFFLMMLLPRGSPLFPYTTLFRSLVAVGELERAVRIAAHREALLLEAREEQRLAMRREDRKSTRLNSSHVRISYAVFCLKKKKAHAAPDDRSAAHTPVRLPYCLTP